MYEPPFEKSWIHPCQDIFYYCIVLKVKAELKSFNVEQFVVKPVCNQRDNEGLINPIGMQTVSTQIRVNVQCLAKHVKLICDNKHDISYDLLQFT